MSLLMDVTVPKKYEGEFDVVITDYNEHENENGGYVELFLQLNKEHEIKFNLFPSSFNYWNEALQRQYNGVVDEETTLAEMIGKAKDEPFRANISWNAQFRRYNIDLYPHDEEETEEAPDLD